MQRYFRKKSASPSTNRKYLGCNVLFQWHFYVPTHLGGVLIYSACASLPNTCIFLVFGRIWPDRPAMPVVEPSNLSTARGRKAQDCCFVVRTQPIQVVATEPSHALWFMQLCLKVSLVRLNSGRQISLSDAIDFVVPCDKTLCHPFLLYYKLTSELMSPWALDSVWATLSQYLSLPTRFGRNSRMRQLNSRLS